jgi:glycosyltransferase involved in cell wall biosynthesis
MPDARDRPMTEPGVPALPRGPLTPRRVLGGIVRRVARLLPAPRDRALISLAGEFRSLVTGKRPRSGRRREDRARRDDALLDRVAWEKARLAYDRRDYDLALRRAEAILAEHPENLKVLKLKRDAHLRRGDLSDALTAMRRMRQIEDSPTLARDERHWIGRLIETDPAWLPAIPGPPRPIDPRDGVGVMHLLKESLPYQQNGFTMRSRYTLVAQRDAGLRPFVVTSLGFPRKDGVDGFPDVELVDGIPHYRLDLGPAYPTHPPYDEHLRDYAWLAARVGRRERPAIIHASSGFRGFETALVGRALREHLRRPLVYEVRSFFETTWSADAHLAESGEHYRRRYETENRCMQAADVVITIAESMRDDIAARGVPRERIHLIPNGVDPAAFVPMDPPEALRRRYRLDGRTTFGYVSTLDHPREGHELLIEATARLLMRGRKVACLIIGDGARRRQLEQQARRAGLGGAVIFTGRVPHDQVRAYYALLDIFVVPRRNDRAARFVTPLKPFEAMAMAKPLVVSDLPALVEIAAPGERGLAFPHDDAGALADRIETLIDAPDQRARFGRAGRDWVLAERTWARNGDRYREIYAELLERWDATGRTMAAPGARRARARRAGVAR